MNNETEVFLRTKSRILWAACRWPDWALGVVERVARVIFWTAFVWFLACRIPGEFVRAVRRGYSTSKRRS